MRIKQLRIKGFKDEQRIVNIEFPDDNIAILFGKNGCGKTSILRIISAILGKTEDVLLEEKVEEVEIVLSDTKQDKTYNIQRYNEDDINDKNRDREDLESKYKWGDFPNNVSSILFGVNRAISYNMNVTPIQIERFLRSEFGRTYRSLLRNRGENFSEDLVHYLNRVDNRSESRLGFSNKYNQLMRNNVTIEKLDMTSVEEVLNRNFNSANRQRSLRVRDAVFNTLSDIVEFGAEKKEKIYQEHINFKDEIMKNKDKLLEALEESTDNSLQRLLINTLKKTNADEIIEDCEKSDIILNLLARMLEELNKEDGMLKAINYLLEIYNEHLSEGKSLKIDEKGTYIEFENKKNNHILSQLSSGEKHLLSLLTGCMIIGSNKNIVMIDEPELSLNVSWKKKILSTLNDILPNAQIIVATHSSSVVNNNFDAMVELE
ncbi:AAA family ATPase [Anaerosporobacter sp.]|uniref:AAA family ATPase n=1 Tax=Anaerosporobacter sp. TaxID=1872529 RepID=UPI00286ED778|nr:AAA family ATPase [Anaerosporobacter sp.]